LGRFVTKNSRALCFVEPVCKHIRKGLEQSQLKKALLNVEWHVCQDCKADNKAQEKSEEETDESPSIWLCLKCGHRVSLLLLISINIFQRLIVEWNNRALIKPFYYHFKCAQQENKDVGNKKVEKDSRNEQEKEVLLKESSHSSPSSEVTVKGLSNLGNTCFFNAVMQNLSQTPVLRELLKEAKMPDTTVKIESPELSMEPQLVKLDQPGPLTLAMHQFLTEMQETKRGVVTPKELFAQVCKKAIRFKGYQQQDSQELLRYLLDGMRAEEIQVSVMIWTMCSPPKECLFVFLSEKSGRTLVEISWCICPVLIL
uniref:ubiquitinyl hydrolase 1 n=1 Tax=Pavo cristatus TaxID=9049 RepID=A0A8C9FGQ1_PAVCR